MKIKGVIEDLKLKKKIFLSDSKNSNKYVYIGLSLVLLWAVWGQFIFR